MVRVTDQERTERILKDSSLSDVAQDVGTQLRVEMKKMNFDNMNQTEDAIGKASQQQNVPLEGLCDICIFGGDLCIVTTFEPTGIVWIRGRGCLLTFSVRVADLNRVGWYNPITKTNWRQSNHCLGQVAFVELFQSRVISFQTLSKLDCLHRLRHLLS